VGAPRTLLALRGLGCLPVVPGLDPPPLRRLRIAWAPKLMRRVNGVLGTVRALIVPSSSSMAFSSTESELELVDTLPRRRENAGPPAVGEVPDRPTVDTERRRRWSFMAAVVMGPGKVFGPCANELLRWKRLVKAAEVTEPRRFMPGEVEVLFELSFDIVMHSRPTVGDVSFYCAKR
jgi:hypothetical protein